MSTKSDIEWTDTTWNPVRGCSQVSAGCANCYAMKFAHRFSGKGKPYEGLTELGPQGPRWTGKIKLVPEALEEPLHWKQPRRIFVNSMSDLFHEDVPDEFIEKVVAIMSLCPQHIFQVLTKRPERMKGFFTQEESGLLDRINSHCGTFMDWDDMPDVDDFGGWPMNHLHIGVSIEDQATADERIPILLQTPAAVRFVSYEPALGLVDLSNDLRPPDSLPGRHVRLRPGEWIVDADGAHLMWRGLDWVILGGESGPGARPCDLAWIRSIKGQCQAAGVPVFIKQLGALPYWRQPWMDGFHYHALKPGAFRYERHGSVLFKEPGVFQIKDKKGGDMAEWPEDLRVREFPC